MNDRTNCAMVGDDPAVDQITRVTGFQAGHAAMGLITHEWSFDDEPTPRGLPRRVDRQTVPTEHLRDV